MFKNYLKITFRNIKIRTGFSFINIFGLAMGICCSMLILLWVVDEMRYDKFHDNKENIYAVVFDWSSYGGGRAASVYAPLGPTCIEQIPEVIDYVRFEDIPPQVIKYGEEVYNEDNIIIADPSFFDVFSFPLIRGTVFNEQSSPFDVILTESMADKYFGEEEPVGKTLQVLNNGREIPINVIGIMKDIPQNSHLQFDFILNFNLVEILGYPLTWFSPNYLTYLLLQENADADKVTGKMTNILSDNTRMIELGVKVLLLPLSKVYLDKEVFPENSGNREYVIGFFILAIFILLIACINYNNLSTARSSIRQKEIGVRKTVGANKKQLINQFISESVLLSIIALVFAIIFIILILPFFNQLSGKSLSLFSNMIIIPISIAITVLIGLISGAYPAFYLSSFKPQSNLKITSSGWKKGFTLRYILTILQFIFSIGFLINTLFVYKQLFFMQNTDLGFDKENVVLVPIKQNIGDHYETIKNEILQIPEVISISGKNCITTESNNTTSGIFWEGKREDQEKVSAETLIVDYDYFRTLGLEIIEGRNFSRDYPSDAINGYILNEEAIRRTELQSPVVGKRFALYDNWGTIIGVMKNANFKSLHEKIEPQVYHLMTDPSDHTDGGYMFIKWQGTQILEIRSKIEKIWEEVNPITPFQVQYMEELYKNLYIKEIQIGKILKFSTIISILIACLGIFGLASFTADKRVKEIAIRKVYGSSVIRIVRLLNSQFVRSALFACLVAWPLSWYIMKLWLQNFAYAIDITVWPFVLSGLVVIIIALITVSYQSIKAALNNPSNSLRYE